MCLSERSAGRREEADQGQDFSHSWTYSLMMAARLSRVKSRLGPGGSRPAANQERPDTADANNDRSGHSRTASGERSQLRHNQDLQKRGGLTNVS